MTISENSTHILNVLRIRDLLDLLEMELERGLRLLLGSRGHYWGEDAQRPLTGVLGRVGQCYLELERRRPGMRGALLTLLNELATLPGGIGDVPRPADDEA